MLKTFLILMHDIIYLLPHKFYVSWKKTIKKVAELMHWGLIPFWAKDKKTSSKLINARAETIHEKPAFRNAFKNNHCIKVMSGFLNGKMKVVKSSPIISKTLTTNYWLSHQFGRNGKIKKMKDSSEAVA